MFGWFFVFVFCFMQRKSTNFRLYCISSTVKLHYLTFCRALWSPCAASRHDGVILLWWADTWSDAGKGLRRTCPAHLPDAADNASALSALLSAAAATTYIIKVSKSELQVPFHSYLWYYLHPNLQWQLNPTNICWLERLCLVKWFGFIHYTILIPTFWDNKALIFTRFMPSNRHIFSYQKIHSELRI